MRAADTIEARLAYLIDRAEDVAVDRLWLNLEERAVIVAALRTVGTAKSEIIRETELSKKHFSLD
jgi:hypothetical protein